MWAVPMFGQSGTKPPLYQVDAAWPKPLPNDWLIGQVAAGLFVDAKNKELFVADGYLNSRVVKFNSETGAFIKAWGAYGNSPVDPPNAPAPSNPNGPYAPAPASSTSRVFNRPVHCVVVSNNGFVYVCDRVRRFPTSP